MTGQRQIFRSVMPVAVCALVLVLFGWMATCARHYGLKPNAAEQNYNLLVRGFQAGQLGLKLAVPPGFAKLPDPYDPAANAEYRSQPYWLHDLSYYRGRLYLYFGVTPAVLLFWPWAALTGHYASHEAAVAVFLAVGFLAGAGMLLRLWQCYFPEVGPAVAAAGVLALGLVAGMPIILQRAEFYEVAISCGSALALLALAGVWLAVDQPARRGRWLAAASLAYGLAVGARPSLLFGAVILLVPIIVSWRERKEGGLPRTPWAVLAAAILPLALCGLGLMLYNDLRFGRIFEFGERYQLAAERVGSKRIFNPGYLWFNIRIYFLEPVRFSRFFPFVRDIASPPLPPGHDPIEHVFGVLTNIPVLWLALAAPLAWRSRTEPASESLRAFVASAALLFAASALVLCLFFGAAGRYELDFLPALAVLAVIGIFGLERVLAPRPSLRIAARGGWALLLGLSVAFSLLESVNRHVQQIDEYGLSLLGAGKLPEAAAQFEHALRIKPDYDDAHTNLANALTGIPGRMPEALAHYEVVVRMDPNLAKAHYNLAAALAQIPHQAPEALKQYEEALRLDPHFAEAHYNLAVELVKIPGRLPEARKHFEAALQINPNHAKAHVALAGILATTPSEMPEALAHYDKALQINPNLAVAHYNYANALMRVPGRLPEAFAHYEAALRLNPNNAEAQNNTAVAYASVGRYAEAKAHLEAALKLEPHNARVIDNLRKLKVIAK